MQIRNSFFKKCAISLTKGNSVSRFHQLAVRHPGLLNGSSSDFHSRTLKLRRVKPALTKARAAAAELL